MMEFLSIMKDLLVFAVLFTAKNPKLVAIGLLSLFVAVKTKKAVRRHKTIKALKGLGLTKGEIKGIKELRLCDLEAELEAREGKEGA